MRNRNNIYNLFLLHFIDIVLCPILFKKKGHLLYIIALIEYLFSKCCICTLISKLHKICVTLLRFSVILKPQCLQKNSCQIPPDTAHCCILQTQ